eukprot:8034012-Pyramimonas_sp.AAC.1
MFVARPLGGDARASSADGILSASQIIAMASSGPGARDKKELEPSLKDAGSSYDRFDNNGVCCDPLPDGQGRRLEQEAARDPRPPWTI